MPVGSNIVADERNLRGDRYSGGSVRCIGGIPMTGKLATKKAAPKGGLDV
jgi:hypothetical protein